MTNEVTHVIDVCHVEQQGRSNGLLGFLDRPEVGDRLDSPRLPVIGWVIGSDGVRAQAVEVRANGNVCARFPLTTSRPDVASAYPKKVADANVGFTSDLPLVGMSPVALVIEAVLADERRVPLASMVVQKRLEGDQSPGPAALVSVVLTVTDAEAPVDQAIDSVVTQTYPNFELVVVNAAGEEIAEQLQRVPSARVVQSRPTVAAARNAGLSESDGSIVVFLDADERLLPNALELGLRELAAQPECAFVSGKCAVTRRYHDEAEYPQQPLVTADHFAVLLGRNYILTPAVAMFRRAALEAVGGFDESLEAFDDYDLYLRVAREFSVGTHPDDVVESPAIDPLSVGPGNRDALERVLAAQEARVAGDPGLETAWRIGRTAWQRRLGGGDATTPGSLHFGDLRRLSPISTNFGFDRGRPVDRYYIESFLDEHAGDVRGRVLEVQENDYTVRFGGDRVERSEVLSLLPDNPKATLVGDLATGEKVPKDAFDCAIVTQVLHLIHEPRAAVATLYQMLKPGGVALVTVPGISQIEWSESWHWSFTLLSARQVFSDVFGRANVCARAYGNVLAATSFLWGIAAEELEPSELDYPDPNYPVTIAVRAVRPETG